MAREDGPAATATGAAGLPYLAAAWPTGVATAGATDLSGVPCLIGHIRAHGRAVRSLLGFIFLFFISCKLSLNG